MKRGISGVIVTVVMVALVLIAISISWTVIQKVIVTQADDVEGAYSELDSAQASTFGGSASEEEEEEIPEECVSNCPSLEEVNCGETNTSIDNCGDACNVGPGTKQSCTLPEVCVDSFCACIPDCSGKVCGDDGCGGSCGDCVLGTECNEEYVCDITDTDLIGWWKFEGDADDSTSNGNDGTVSGATLTTGKVGQGYEFDGIDDSIALPNSVNSHSTSTFSVQVWMYSRDDSTEDGNATMILDNYHYNWVAKGYFLDFNDGKIYFSIGSSDQIFMGLGIGNPYDFLNKWTLVTGTFDNSNIKLYANDELLASSTFVNGSGYAFEDITANDADPIIGEFVGGGWGDALNLFHGTLDEVRIWNRALSQTEISEIYNLEK